MPIARNATSKLRSKTRAPRRIVPPAPYTIDDADPKVDALVHELIGRIADKWTMVILEVLAEYGELRFSRLAERAGNISQKMLTQTLRHMERDGLVVRTVHPVIPPKVEYRLTELGETLGEAFCGVWQWAAKNLAKVEGARDMFDARSDASSGKNG